MLGWAVTFLVIALIAAVLGFGGIAGLSMEIAKIIFFVAIVLRRPVHFMGKAEHFEGPMAQFFLRMGAFPVTLIGAKKRSRHPLSRRELAEYVKYLKSAAAAKTRFRGSMDAEDGRLRNVTGFLETA